MTTTTRTGARLVAATGAFALIGSLAACGSSADEAQGTAEEPVTITFWDNNAGPDRTPVYEELIDRFEAENETIRVEYVGIPAADAAEKYETAVAGGSTPDVGIVVGFLLSSLAAQEALEPLDDRLADSELAGRIAEDSITAAQDAGPDGQLYIVPFTGTPDTLWYRADQFQAAGLTPPETWPDFYTAAEALTDPAAGQFGFVMRGGAGSVNQLVSVLYSCSEVPEFFDGDTTTLDDPANAQCLQDFADTYNTSTAQADVGYGYQEMVTAFDGGSAAMMQHNLGSARNHAEAFGEGVVDGLPMPASAGGKRTVVSTTPEGPAVFAGSENPDAAWAFAQYLGSHEAASYWNEQAGQIPANTDARADEWVTSDEVLNRQIETLDDPETTVITSPLYLPDWNGILGEMAPGFQSVLLEERTAQDFLTEWADKVDAAEAEYREQFAG